MRTSVKDLIAAIGIFNDSWNDRCTPFVWTKTAEQIIPAPLEVKTLQKRDTSDKCRHFFRDDVHSPVRRRSASRSSGSARVWASARIRS
ncbi:hypothetical protein EV644_1128 [Kribbella orskensis]|uniref:Mutator family transposase n=1 Tax=Kribbella orskensis TaxID=2512216 RepID=A0ABY2BEV7_9ACTN|nr:hypothetical protein EV642_1138 [Kribbella sp. VKM Ac-2500]TCO18268.1 hypothetical protein EV644_1128 [Kribbella orskensis]